MTVVVAFLCSDGAVIAADSMLTPTLGQLNVGHHKAIKVHALSGPQIVGWAGDQGQAARFTALAEMHHQVANQVPTTLEYPLGLTQGLIAQFTATGIVNSIGVNAVLAFLHRGSCRCCVFEGPMQPRLLDAQHYYVVLGSGKLSADPFVRFITDIFCRSGQPNVREATFLATWTIQHVIDTNPGGVAGPIRITVFKKDLSGTYSVYEIPEDELEEHQQAIESAADALRNWRSGVESGDAAKGVPPPPASPSQPAQPPAPAQGKTPSGTSS